MLQLRLRVSKAPVRSHSKWWDWNSNPGHLDSKVQGGHMGCIFQPKGPGTLRAAPPLSRSSPVASY